MAKKEETKTIYFPVAPEALNKELDGLNERLKTLRERERDLGASREMAAANLRLMREELRPLTAALGGLKNALLQATLPIYNAVLPALTTLVNGLSRAAATVGRFIAALLGTKQAKASTKALEKETKALSGTGKAAKEAAGSLAAFDEINTIDVTDKPGSGGGGGGGRDAASADGEEVWDETAPMDWGLAFSNFLDEILESGLPRLRRGFETFARWLNGFSVKLYGMFRFQGIREKVERLGAELAGAFNGLIAAVDWRTLGAALGAGLDLALVLMAESLYGMDWPALGRGLAEGLNGLVQQVDWANLGRLLWSGFKRALELLAGFLLGLDMTELAQAANRLVMGFFNSVRETIALIDWRQIGQQIGTFLVNIDWLGIAQTVAMALGEAFGAVAAILWGIISEAWQEVIDWWRERACEDGHFTMEGLLCGILEVVSGLGQWLNEQVVRPFIDIFCALFGIHSPSAVMAELGGRLMEGLQEGILNKFGPVLDAVRTILSGITGFISGVFTSDWSRAWQGVQNVFRGIWNGIVSMLEGAVNLVISGVNWMIGQLNRLQIRVPAWLGGGTLGFNIPLISGVSIPRLAQGAVIPPNREFMAVLGDNKKESEIVSPLSTMKQAFLEALRESGGAGGDINITLELDGKVVARNTVRHVNDMTRCAGRSVLIV